MLVIIISIAVAIYFITITTGSGNKLSSRATKIIRVVLFVLATALVVIMAVTHLNIYPRGYWVKKGLFWIVVFLMMVLFGFGNRSLVKGLERIIYGIFFYLPLWVIPFLLIPLIGPAIGLEFYVSFIGDKSVVVFSDENIRIEQQYIRFLGEDPPLEIYVKHGFLSSKDTVLPIMYNDKKDSIRVVKLTNSTYTLTHYSPDNWEVPDGSEQFNFSLKSK